MSQSELRPDLGPRSIGAILPRVLTDIAERTIAYHAGRAADPKLSPAEHEAAALECEGVKAVAHRHGIISGRRV
jgi:hypothetical protein